MMMMNDGILSQEEIDALLKGQGQAEPASSDHELNEIEEDTLGEVGNICMGTSATTLSTLLGKKVSITTPRIRYTTRKQLCSEYPLPYVVVEVKYRDGLKGSNVLVIKKEDASIIADLMMGGEGLIAELNDLSLSAVSEAMNQMMGSATTSMSSMFDQRIDIYPPNLAMVDFANDSEIGFILDEDYENLVQISFKMVIENLLDSEIMQLIPVAYAREMVSTLMKNIPGQEPNEDHSEPAPQKDDFITDELSMSWEETESQIDWGPEPVDFTVPPSPTTNPSAATTDNRSGIKKGQVAVRPVQFAGLDEPATQKEVRNIDIILDVPLDVAVELGKTKKSIKEILELGPGSIIQLDRLAGEPVDLLVNGKLIAKGEVVVIDENYGIRISAIVSPMDRMTKLQ
jgi:flagellar motor switch protein FliN/FliY